MDKKFKDEDETILLQKTYDYGTILTPPREIFPYKDSSNLPLYRVWAFEGYYDRFSALRQYKRALYRSA